MGAVHVCVGAGVGALCRTRALSAALGTLSHAVCDIIPHSEAPLKLDLVLMAAVLGGLAGRFGLRSKEIAGAVAAVLPDAEHALVHFGAMPRSARVFPTHNRALPHGRSDEWLSQAAVGIAALLVAELAGRRRGAS